MSMVAANKLEQLQTHQVHQPHALHSRSLALSNDFPLLIAQQPPQDIWGIEFEDIRVM